MIALIIAVLGTATMSFGGSDVTTPRAIPYSTSNLATGFNQPTAVAIDDNGNVYVGENYTGATAGTASALVKKIDAATGQVTVFAGGAPAKATTGNSTCANPDRNVPGGGDIVGDGCPATSAWFGGTNGGIRGLAVWNNYLYIEDLGGYLIHRVNLATNIMELVGGGPTSATWPGDGGPAVVGFDITKNFNLWKPPTGFAVDPLNGNVYFGAGGTNAATIRMITSDATTCANAASGPFTAPCVITVVNYTGQTATSAPANVCADPTATLTARNATVWYPQGLTFDADRNLYIAENQCYAVRKLTKNPATNIVDQNSTFTTLVGNNSKTGASPSWYDTAAAPAFFGPVRGLASAGGNNLYIATTTAVYFYDGTTRWAHRIWGDTPTGCTGYATAPYIGCPAPWATRTDNSGTGAMAVDKAGNLYVTDYAAGAVEKASLGTDFIGIAPPTTVSLPMTQYVLLHGGAVTNATADAPFSATVTTDTVPKPGCNSYVATGDNGTDCVMAVKYTPSVHGTETGLLHVLATVNADLPLQALGNPATAPQVSLAVDKSVCGVAAACDILLTATVIPGSNPVSTGLAVSGDMTVCAGGSGSQAFDPGASNTFTYTCSLPTTTAIDFHLGPVQVTDAQARTGQSSSVLVSVIDPPVAQPQTVAVTYNTAKSITLSATGTGVLTYSVVSQPTHGTLSGDAPALTYTPTSNYVGSDSFTFRASNGAESAAATVTINVLPAAPVANELSVEASFNATTQITLTATGTGNLTYAIVRPPAHGALAGTAPNVSYTPDSNYSGPDSFTFKATDENGQESVPATVSITVLSVVPEAQNQSVVVTQNTPKPITLVATGMGTLTYTVLTQPTHGVLTGTAPNLIYTPNTDYLGADSFTFKATSDTATDSAPATISITVLPAPPVAASQAVTVNYASSASITLAATGTGALTYSVVSQPAHGTLSGTAPNLTYTAAANYSGPDSFTFKATDSNNQESAPATVSITVLPAAPVAASQSVTVIHNTAQAITLSATGTGSLTYTVVTEPTHGTLSGTAPELVYTPAANYGGSDSFTFRATDGHNQESAIATVSLTVLPAVPVADSQSVTATYNTAKSITLSAAGTGALTFAVKTQPSHGTLSGTAPALTYTPTSNYLGADSFSFTATDSHGQESAEATVSITVVPPVPVATAQSVTVTYNAAKAITLSGTGFGTLTYTVASQPAHGTLSGTAPNLTYTPTDSYSGSDSFTFKVTDTNAQVSGAATVSITVAAPDLTIVPSTGGSAMATVTAGHLAIYNLQVTAWNGASGPISFTCSGAPAGANCAVSSNSTTLNGTSPIAISVSVQTTAPAAAASIVPSTPSSGLPWGTLLVSAMLLSGMISLRNRKLQLRLAAACTSMALVLSLCSCGSSGSGAFGSSNTATPAGTYTVTVTATAGNVTKTIPLTLNVR